jgi:uncharacterized protein (TIGR02118 family)
MIAITFLLRRAEGTSPDEFQRHWRERHAPLVKRHAARLGIRRYVQLHATGSPAGAFLAESRGCEPSEYDGVALISFDSEEALTEAASTPEGAAAGAELLDDERRFLDLSRCQLWISVEDAIV